MEQSQLQPTSRPSAFPEERNDGDPIETQMDMQFDAVEQNVETFRVQDESSANWVTRKILESRAYAKRCAEWCEHEQARARRTEEFFLFHYQQQLIDFARQRLREENGRRKSVNLPAGRIGFRAEPAKLIVVDEATVIAWAKQNKPELVQTIERLSKSALNQHIETTGEIPDVGVHVEPAREKFYIR